MLDQSADLIAAFDGDDAVAAGGDLLNLAEGFSYLRTLPGAPFIVALSRWVGL